VRCALHTVAEAARYVAAYYVSGVSQSMTFYSIVDVNAAHAVFCVKMRRHATISIYMSNFRTSSKSSPDKRPTPLLLAGKKTLISGSGYRTKRK
jgi:hypothetical protein